MKKIALLLAVVLLFGCCFAFASCDESSDNGSLKTSKEKAQDTVRSQMMVEMPFKTLGGSSISFVSCTYGSTKELSNGNFKISGTVKVRDQYGNFHVANYDAEVEYDAATDDYDADIDYGSFKKQ